MITSLQAPSRNVATLDWLKKMTQNFFQEAPSTSSSSDQTAATGNYFGNKDQQFSSSYLSTSILLAPVYVSRSLSEVLPYFPLILEQLNIFVDEIKVDVRDLLFLPIYSCFFIIKSIKILSFLVIVLRFCLSIIIVLSVYYLHITKLFINGRLICLSRS